MYWNSIRNLILIAAVFLVAIGCNSDSERKDSGQSSADSKSTTSEESGDGGEGKISAGGKDDQPAETAPKKNAEIKNGGGDIKLTGPKNSGKQSDD